MNLHIVSDLHLAHCPIAPADICADVLILAGDISDGGTESLLNYTVNYRQAGKPVLFIPGNHEYYGHTMAARLLQMKKVSRTAGIMLMHNRCSFIKSVRFIGSTLWTDFKIGGSDQARSLILARTGMSDYECIQHNGRQLSPELTLKWHQRAIRFIERTFAKPFEGKTVLIVHHGVHPNSISSNFVGHPLTPAFASDLSALLLKWQPRLVIHGHVHHRVDYRVGTSHVVANPRGYSQLIQDSEGLFEWPEHGNFDPKFVVEL